MSTGTRKIHIRIAIGGAILMVPLLLWTCAMSSAAAPPAVRRAASAAMPVRYAEGTVHGFLELRTAAGAFLAHGDLLQLVKEDGIESRMVFHFANSVFEETVTFTQRDVFTLQAYHLVQSGPAFPADLEVTMARSGAYVVRTRSHDEGEETTYAGTLELPPDVYNGMVVTIAKNLAANTPETVHIVAFTPKPRIIRLELAPAGTGHVLLGTHEEAALHIVLKPRLGALLRFFATIARRAPPNSDVWIVTDQVPAFVRFQGPMYSGPVWRIDLASPNWPQ
jgi:hypothetical protein